MPLKAAKSNKAIAHNISKLRHEGYKKEQAAAIAYDKAGRGKKKGKRGK